MLFNLHKSNIRVVYPGLLQKEKQKNANVNIAQPGEDKYQIEFEYTHK